MWWVAEAKEPRGTVEARKSRPACPQGCRRGRREEGQETIHGGAAVYFILKATDPTLGILENTIRLVNLRLAIQGNRLLVGITRHRSPIKTCLLIRKKRTNVKENAEKMTENMIKEGTSLTRSTEHLRIWNRKENSVSIRSHTQRMAACKPMEVVYLDRIWGWQWNQHNAVRRQLVSLEINKYVQNPHKWAQCTAQEMAKIKVKISQGPWVGQNRAREIKAQKEGIDREHKNGVKANQEKPSIRRNQKRRRRKRNLKIKK